jgi:hypothetical protein
MIMAIMKAISDTLKPNHGWFKNLSL